MLRSRKNVLSIAGFDPSAGAGLLADIKTFQAHAVYGSGVCTGLTFQSDIEFDEVNWVVIEDITKQIDLLIKRNKFEWIKIGLIENMDVLQELLEYLNHNISDAKIVWDPILKASAGYQFHDHIEEDAIKDICQNIFLITPNADELSHLVNASNWKIAGNRLSDYCNVFLKSIGNDDKATDVLFHVGQEYVLEANSIKYEKHGSGCVLSASIVSNLVKGHDLLTSCALAKDYTFKFLKSSTKLIGYHSIA